LRPAPELDGENGQQGQIATFKTDFQGLINADGMTAVDKSPQKIDAAIVAFAPIPQQQLGASEHLHDGPDGTLMSVQVAAG
jgi:hypothetical protein